jgi:hypothetical protein
MVFMRAASLVLLAVLGLTVPGNSISAQSQGAVSSNAPIRIADAEVSEDGTVKIRFNDGRSIQVPADKGQAGRKYLQVAASGRSVGWLEVNVPVGSYSVPVTLTVYTVGKSLRHFGDGLMLLDWQFVDGDKQVQFSSSQVHGPGSLWHTMEVHDIQTGRLTKRWIEPANSYALEDVVLADLKGRVADSTGSALSGAAVAVRVPPSTEMVAPTITEPGGTFQIPNLQPGQYEVRVEGSGFQQRTIPVTIGPNGADRDLGTLILVKRIPAPK